MARTKHQQIFDYIQRSILEGEFQDGRRIPSENQLVKQFGVARATVAKALRELEHLGLLTRRRGSGSYVCAPEGTATESAVGLLVPGLGEGEIFEPICSAIAATSPVHGMRVVWGQCGAKDPREKCEQAEQLCQEYIDQGLDGVFFAPIELAPKMHDTNARIARRLKDSKLAVVLLDCDILPFPDRSEFDLVGIDNWRAGYVLARHLLQQGLRRIEFVCRPGSARTVDARIAGYREAMAAHGINCRPGWIRRGEPDDDQFVRKLMQPQAAEAVICGNDYTAAQLMTSLMQRGVRIPEDVRVVGVDDLKFAGLLSVPLTTIHQPCEAIGTAAVQTMRQRLRQPTQPAQDVLLDFQLVPRKSSSSGNPED